MTITNPLLAGDLVDVSSSSDLQLTVGGSLVDLSSPYFSIDALDFNYDSKTVAFSEIATPSIGRSTYSLNDDVTLQINFGSGLTTYFRGKVKKSDHEGKNQNERIQYTAVGQQTLANEIVLLNPAGIPYVQYKCGEQTTTIGTLTFYGRSVQDAITDIFTLAVTALTALGISTTIGTPGIDTLNGVLAEDLQFQNTNFIDAINQILAKEPERRLYFDDVQDAWTFPNPLTADLVAITISSVNLNECAYSMDISNRYTAIDLVAAYESILPVPSKIVAACEPAWGSAAEADWCIQKTGVADAQNFNVDYLPVFRSWTITGDVTKIVPMSPVRAYAAISWFDQVAYVPIDAEIDLNAKTVLTKSPLIVKGNPFVPRTEPGCAEGPTGVVVTGWSIDSVPITGWPHLRYPSSGYEGTAYTLYGIERLKTEFVDATLLNSVTAISRLRLLKDVIVTADFPIEGDPIPELINLQKRVIVNHPSIATGLESIGAVFMSYQYKFGKRGSSTIGLTTDLSGLFKAQ